MFIFFKSNVSSLSDIFQKKSKNYLNNFKQQKSAKTTF